MQFYLLNLSVCGIKNIETPVEISFYKKTINNDFDPQKYKIKAIYGENGSGKTAIITAVNILRHLMIDQNYLGDNNTQRSLYEIVNRKNKSGFISCEYISKKDNSTFIFNYRISFEIQRDNRFYITGEELKYKKGISSKKAYTTVFEVENGVLNCLGNDQDVFGFIEKKTANLLRKQSLLSSCVELFTDGKLQFEDDLIYSLISNAVSFGVSMDVWIDDVDDHTEYIHNHSFEYDSLLINENAGESDNGYTNFLGDFFIGSKSDKVIPKVLLKYYKRKTEKMASFIKVFKPELKNIELDTKEYGENLYKCNLKMIYDDYIIDKEFESRGIKKIMELFDYLDRACRGGIVFIDELDANISDVYLDKMIEYFKLYGKGQLCFTAHNLSPMNVLKDSRNAIDFISGINTVHTWTRHGNMSPENAYRNGFIEDSPFNVDASDFLGILGDVDE